MNSTNQQKYSLMIQFMNGDLINLYMNSTNQQKILAEQGISQSNNKGKKKLKHTAFHSSTS